MGCFIVPGTEAIVATIVKKAVEKKEDTAAAGAVTKPIHGDGKIKLSQKLKWLSNMLWGGSALLAFEHVWHGEVVPYFPFLTAMNDPADAAEMFHEMSTAGVGMAVVVTLFWAGMVVISNALEKRGDARFLQS